MPKFSVKLKSKGHGKAPEVNAEAKLKAEDSTQAQPKGAKLSMADGAENTGSSKTGAVSKVKGKLPRLGFLPLTGSKTRDAGKAKIPSPVSSLLHKSPAQDPASEDELSALDSASIDEHERGARLSERIRLLWGQALVTVTNAEEEAQRVLGKLTTWIELRPEEAKRLADELAARLTEERQQIERSMDTAVRSALRPFRIPGKSELSTLEQRLDKIEVRIDALLAAKNERASLPR